MGTPGICIGVPRLGSLHDPGAPKSPDSGAFCGGPPICVGFTPGIGTGGVICPVSTGDIENS